ncbi:3',5'-bisphosphate nucleotidase [Rhizopus microsporus var. microsporus]|uniref:3'(2'),5'-bisphosphate nucleotidase n=2 Tax=Rhizopus microsporus TaxID=58291 RepID=A0A2G4SYK3_RHIZD|nr:3(2),5-bisphosphate nucleotidase HAL2 [Rhizopus microsporus ATCC 52813]ORE07428.1 3',5'-bisphosphate nucleotidase [Rhizopus microsporus var. microsporus]PHZ13851.1 3(2),5-bisphosphate nucleotidase HAL2 [Rhizopus microsporus ATCC 52813]
MSDFSKERAVAIQAVLTASKVCQSVFQHLVANETLTKNDKSPVTVADFSAQAIINTFLYKHFPNDPIVGEEDSKDLQGDSGKALRDKVVSLTNGVLSQDEVLSEQQILDAIDRGNYAGGSRGRHWALDPIDGTKGFLRGGQYAVCLALIVDGIVQVGVIGCPNLPVNHHEPQGEKGALFIAVRGQGAFQRSFSNETETRIQFADISSTEESTFCESVEAGHSSHGDAEEIAKLLGITRTPVRMDSQAKYCSISRGDADIYLRLPTSKAYVEKIWDHASGNVLVTEAGGKVTDIYGQSLDFSIGRTLEKNKGVIASKASIHPQVLKAVQKVLNIE